MHSLQDGTLCVGESAELGNGRGRPGFHANCALHILSPEGSLSPGQKKSKTCLLGADQGHMLWSQAVLECGSNYLTNDPCSLS